MEILSPRIIHEAALQEDEFAISVIKDLGEKLGFGLVSVMNVLDISNVIVGGGVAGFGRLLFNSISCSIKDRILTSKRNLVKVRQAKLKNNAGIKGAASLVYYN